MKPVLITSILVVLTATFSDASRAHPLHFLDSGDRSLVDAINMGRICAGRLELVARNDEQVSTLNACARSCSKVASMVKTAPEQKDQAIELVHMCEHAFESLPPDYQQDPNFLAAEKIPQEEQASGIEIIELGDVYGRVRPSILSGVQIVTDHPEFNALCAGMADGSSNYNKAGGDAVLKDVRYRRYTGQPGAKGRCTFSAIVQQE